MNDWGRPTSLTNYENSGDSRKIRLQPKKQVTPLDLDTSQIIPISYHLRLCR
jgi:hypothetical protein